MKEKTLTIYGVSTYNRPEYPLIRLSGKWILDLGFKMGDKITVRFARDKIIIKPYK